MQPIVNGVYEFEYNNSGYFLPNTKYCVVPESNKVHYIADKHSLKLAPERHVIFFNHKMLTGYPDWECFNDPDNNFKIGKFVGMYDWETNTIKYTTTESENNVCSHLISSFTSEVLDIYEHGIFRAKVTTRNNDQWVHFDCIGSFDNDNYGYTKDEFLTMMPMLREIEEKLLKNEEN